MLHTISNGMTISYIGILILSAICNFVVVPVPVHVILMSVFIIYIGSHLSINFKEEREENGESEEETMTKKDAYMFPVIGSCVLFGLYVLFKIFDKDMVNLLLSLYFTLIGTYTLSCTFSPFIAQLFPKKQKTLKWSCNIPFYGPFHVDMTLSDILSIILAGAFAIGWFKTRHFLLNNLFGISFSIKGIETLALGSYQVGAILLSGLFFYDIFWVFGTEVMVTVAKSFDAPIKLLFPRVLATATEEAKFSMLGLGDIVIPGIFIALLLRFDAANAGVKKEGGVVSYAFSKPFFHTNLFSYAMGLLTTLFIMFYFNHAQPALLYLVPACLGSSLLQGALTKQFHKMWNYSEEKDEKENTGAKTETKTSKKSKSKKVE